MSPAPRSATTANVLIRQDGALYAIALFEPPSLEDARAWRKQHRA